MEIYIDGNFSNIRFSCAHFIPGDWKCDRIHGHDYSLSARIAGELGDKSYFLDFSSAKNSLKEIADFLDHRILIPTENPSVKIERTERSVKVGVRDKEYEFPIEECRFLPIKDSTAECLSNYILQRFRETMVGNYQAVEIEVHEGPGQYAKSSWKK
ncbi:MAG: 6-carboxytetrahydropterin synthase [Candidatus Thermoplasmatota archaeon]|jgi:6-pyruvoyltetrahydropterin/6-carboxytetrahydropterin synthase|nr:6-carboxytetrahydropterin synthase [Candidatus Thermoplasmatota archaeon]